MIVVSDTSVISNLFQIQYLELLPALYDEIFIPKAVYAELSASHKSDLLPKLADFNIKVVLVDEIEAGLFSKENNLDKGESEAIVLAKKIQPDFLIIDEGLGRKIAVQNGLTITGLLGVIMLAKRIGMINSVKSLYNDLQQMTTFRFPKWLYEKLLLDAGEK